MEQAASPQPENAVIKRLEDDLATVQANYDELKKQLSLGVDAPAAIYGLMKKIMSEVGVVAKSKRNQEQNFNYRGIDDIYNAVGPIFAKHGVFTVPTVIDEQSAERKTATGKVMFWTRFRVSYKFYAPDGSFFEAVLLGEGQDMGDKGGNKALSGAHKQVLLQVLMIATEDNYGDGDKDPPPTSGNSNRSSRGAPKPSKGPTPVGLPQPKADPSPQPKPPVTAPKIAVTGFMASIDVPFGEFKGKKLNDLTVAELETFGAVIKAGKLKEAIAFKILFDRFMMERKKLEPKAAETEPTPHSEFLAAVKSSGWPKESLQKVSEHKYKTADSAKLTIDQMVEFTKLVKRPYAEVAAELGL